MKHLKFIFLFVVSINLLVACKKDKEDINIPASVVVGMYEGKYGTGGNNPNHFYSFNLKSSGILEELNNTGTVIGNGTWTISGETFRGKCLYVSPSNSFFSFKATFDITTDELSGTWGYGDSETDGGKWYMTKQ